MVVATIVLRPAQLARHCKRAGLLSNYALAKVSGINRAQIGRVRAGQSRPGHDFIAGMLHALPEARFGDLFDVVPVTNAAARKAAS